MDSRDTDATLAAILRLLDDSALHGRLRVAGLETAAGFSYEAEAERHLALYRRRPGAPTSRAADNDGLRRPADHNAVSLPVPTFAER